MGFVFAFVAILVVSWVSGGQSGGVPEGSTGAAKSVKELTTAFEKSSRIVNPKPDGNDELVTATGSRTTVKELIVSYENFQKSYKLEKTRRGGRLPTLQEVKEAIKKGKKFSASSPLCLAGSSSEKRKKEWYEHLCF